VLAQHGHDIVDLVSVAEMEVEALRQGASGTYRIAAFPTAARSYVTDGWRQLHEDAGRGPALRLIELEPDDATAALGAGEVDLAITHAYSNVPPLNRPGLTALHLATEDVLLAVPADAAVPLTDAGVADLADQAGAPWVVPHADLACAQMVRHACAAAGFRPTVVAEATDFSVQLALVAAGVAVALVPTLAANAALDRLRLLALQEPVARHHFALVRRSSRNDAGIRRILDVLADNAARVVGGIGSLEAANVSE
jgi:DNA-binding transcriptional LysR family regulator